MFLKLSLSYRAISVFCNSSRNAFTPQARNNATKVFRVVRPQSEKKEPLQAVKWVLLVIPVTSFGLGCWQLHRLRWKLDLIDRLHSTSHAEPVDLPTDFTELERMEYMPVRVRGQFLHDKEILIGPRALIEHDKLNFGGSLVSDPKKNQGWLVITPFILKDTNDVILVNRGWVPPAQRARATRAASAVPGEVELTGVVRLTEKRAPFMPKNNPEKGSWFSRDLDEMASHLGCSPVWIDARGTREPPDGWPVPNQTRVTLRNEHMSYVVTWFSLSAFTGFMWHRIFIRKLPLL